MNQTTRKIVIAGVLSALSVLLGTTVLGFIPWWTQTSLTFMTVPVIVGAVLEGPWVGLAIGFVLGASSLVQANIAPRGAGDVIFTNPLISIAPRLFIGPVAWLVHKALSDQDDSLALKVATVAGSVVNTILVLVMVGLHQRSPQTLDNPAARALMFAAGVGSALLVAWLVYRVLKGDKAPVTLTVVGMAGSLTNTILVLGVIGLLQIAPWTALVPIALFNGLPEAVVAAVITVAVVTAWRGIETGRTGSTV